MEPQGRIRKERKKWPSPINTQNPQNYQHKSALFKIALNVNELNSPSK